MMLKDLVFVESMDWEGLYINGLLVMESNGLSVAEVTRAVGGRRIVLTPDQERQLRYNGGLPKQLELL